MILILEKESVPGSISELFGHCNQMMQQKGSGTVIRERIFSNWSESVANPTPGGFINADQEGKLYQVDDVLTERYNNFQPPYY